MERITGRSCAQMLAVQQNNNATPAPSLLVTPFPQGKVGVPKSQEALLLLPVGKREAAFLCGQAGNKHILVVTQHI